MISGLYKGVFSSQSKKKAARQEIELRIDVDGERPMTMISGDIYSLSESKRKYVSSFKFGGVEKKKNSLNQILLAQDSGEFHLSSESFKKIEVSIPLNVSPFEATVKLLDRKSNESTCLCRYKSKYFRTVHVEHDYEEDIVPFESYNTNDLLPSSHRRSHRLTIAGAYAVAGIRLVITNKMQSRIPHPKRIPRQGAIWTDSELDKAMVKHFSQLSKLPKWDVWLFSANEYAISNVKGLMLAHKRKQRVGCVVFQRATGWRFSQEKRMRLFIYVHELGHCFNLPHPWHKHKPNHTTLKDDSLLSWMNYPWGYFSKDKSQYFWKLFNFQFSNSELIHLRHAFRNDIIFGGNTTVDKE